MLNRLVYPLISHPQTDYDFLQFVSEISSFSLN